MYCICCKKNNVTPYDGFSDSQQSEESQIWEREKREDGSLRTIDNKSANDGVIKIMSSGYGSTHDGDQFVIAICDSCIKENLKDATLLYWGNYMFHDEFIEEEVEKSKLAYRRRKNLDNLL